jgi:hypothetical protein
MDPLLIQAALTAPLAAAEQVWNSSLAHQVQDRVKHGLRSPPAAVPGALQGDDRHAEASIPVTDWLLQELKEVPTHAPSLVSQFAPLEAT